MQSEDDDSDRSSAQSASPPASPVAGLQARPSVDRLVQYFAFAKRSLSATNYVFRVNELVTSSRTLLEEIAVLRARNTFARRATEEQVDALYSIKDGLSAAGEDAGEEFRGTIEKLDLANDRLERTLNALKKTVVDTSLQQSLQHEVLDAHGIENGGSLGEEKRSGRTLFDFIDETNHADLQSSLRGLIDTYQDSRADLDETINKFDESLKTIHANLSDNERRDKSPDLGTIYDERPWTIPQIFRGMEEHAAEMATLLQSLISHYDLCVSALKHTEGGGEAAKRAIQQADETLSKNGAQGVEESLYLRTVPEPISENERNDMLRVLENDAHEVQDVVGEIKDHNRDVQNLYGQLVRHAKNARGTDDRLRHVLGLLHEMKDIHLPSHVHALTSFKASWKRTQTSIESQTAELASLSSFYDSFLSGYAKLLREVDRRKEAKRQMRKVAEKARKDLNKLFEADQSMREDFMEETGKFLPQGIWDDFVDEGMQWEIKEIGTDER